MVLCYITKNKNTSNVNWIKILSCEFEPDKKNERERQFQWFSLHFIIKTMLIKCSLSLLLFNVYICMCVCQQQLTDWDIWWSKAQRKPAVFSFHRSAISSSLFIKNILFRLHVCANFPFQIGCLDSLLTWFFWRSVFALSCPDVSVDS